jgi:hypothetical protein
MRPARKMKRVFLNDEKYTNHRPRRVLPRNTRSTPGLAAAAAAAAARRASAEVAEGIEDVEARRANAVEGRAGGRVRADVEARRANAAEGGKGGRRLANRNPITSPPTPPLPAPPPRREENVEVETAGAEDAEEEEAKRPSTMTENGVGLPARRSIGAGVRVVCRVLLLLKQFKFKGFAFLFFLWAALLHTRHDHP